MNRLKNKLVYMAGNIDAVADLGMGWRDELTPFLLSLGLKVINPCKKPKNLIDETQNEDHDFRQKRQKLKQEEKYDELHDVMNPIIQADLHFVDMSNFLIVGLDMDKRPCGTLWEVCIANLARKPVLVKCAGGKKNVPDWMYGLMPHELFFDTWQELKQYLHVVNSAPKIETYGRWRLFDFETETEEMKKNNRPIEPIQDTPDDILKLKYIGKFK